MVNKENSSKLNAELTRLRSEVGLLRAQLNRHNVRQPLEHDVYPMMVEWLIDKKSRATIAEEMGLPKAKVAALTNKWLSKRVNLSAIKSEHVGMVWAMRLTVLRSGCRDSDTVTKYYKIAKENGANRSVLAEISSRIKQLERKEQEERREEQEARRARVEQFIGGIRAQLSTIAMMDGPRPVDPIDVSEFRALDLTRADIPDDLIGVQLIVRNGRRYPAPVVVRLGVSQMEV